MEMSVAHRSVPRPPRADVIVGLVALAAGAADAADTTEGSELAGHLLVAILVAAAVSFRSVAPVRSLLGAALALGALIPLGIAGDSVLLLAPLLAVYSIGEHGDARSMWWGTGIAAVLYGAYSLLVPEVGLYAIGFGLSATGLGLLVGRAVRTLGTETEVLAARNEVLRVERDESAAVAVAAERARIARELHDVIGHSISVMGVQAGAVRRRLTPEQEREREALLVVERTGRDAVAEMRQLLGFLRPDGGPEPATTPLPTLQRADDLVAAMRASGQAVELRVDGDLETVPPGLALAAFRVLQEALNNALKHAPGARVTATLRRSHSELAIAVVDDGRGTTTRPEPAALHVGHGLVAMRERVALYGGRFAADHVPGGGFAVHADLPIPGDR